MKPRRPIEQQGATTLEYAVLIALVAIATIAGLAGVGSEARDTFQVIVDTLRDPSQVAALGSGTATLTPGSQSTQSPTSTAGAQATNTQVPTVQNTSTPPSGPTPTATDTRTPAFNTPTATTFATTPASTPTATATETYTPVPTPTATYTPTDTPVPTPTDTPVPTPTDTPTPACTELFADDFEGGHLDGGKWADTQGNIDFNDDGDNNYVSMYRTTWWGGSWGWLESSEIDASAYSDINLLYDRSVIDSGQLRVQVSRWTRVWWSWQWSDWESVEEIAASNWANQTWVLSSDYDESRIKIRFYFYGGYSLIDNVKVQACP
jgi:Flp pilus assembly pilin Flp